MARRMRRDRQSPLAGRSCLLAAASLVELACCTAVPAQPGPSRFLLSTAQVVSAIEGRQIPSRGIELRLAAPVTSTVPNPLLQIEDIAPVNARELRLRVSCQDHSECLPFFAFATYPASTDLSSFKNKTEPHPAGAPNRASDSKPPVPTQSATTVPDGSEPHEPAVRSGSPASLDFDEDRVHVRVDVICLENGALGDKVRVTTRDRKRIYVAQVVAPNTLKGTFPR